MSKQTTSHILMVRPANFGFNEETAANNAFQSNDLTLTPEQIRTKAIAEFDAFVGCLRNAGVDVIVAEDTPHPVKPDAVFPNNWVTFHEDGTVITYPMFAPVRRLERREDILQMIQQRFLVVRKIRLEEYENADFFLEGTGSMIFDRPNRIVYACISPRTTPWLLQRFCKLIEFEPVAFHATDAQGQDIYHTNVMMALGESFVVICMDSIQDERERHLLLEKFALTHKEVISITQEQVLDFAGNMLQVQNTDGKTFLVMSEQAFNALAPDQIERMKAHTDLLYCPIPTIEKFGGGSARCMMAEIFLPEKS